MKFIFFLPTIPSSSSLAVSSSPDKFYIEAIMNHKIYNKMFICCNERNISKLVFEIYSQGFNPIAHWVTRSYSRKIYQEFWNYSLFLWFFKVIFIWWLVWFLSLSSISFSRLTHFYFFFKEVIILLWRLLLIILFRERILWGCNAQRTTRFLWTLATRLKITSMFSLILINLFHSWNFFFCFRNIEIARRLKLRWLSKLLHSLMSLLLNLRHHP